MQKTLNFVAAFFETLVLKPKQKKSFASSNNDPCRQILYHTSVIVLTLKFVDVNSLFNYNMHMYLTQMNILVQHVIAL